MRQIILDLIDERVEVSSELDTAARHDGLLLADPDWAEQRLRRLLADPFQRDRLLSALQEDVAELSSPPDDHQLCRLAATRLSQGALVMARPGADRIQLGFFEVFAEPFGPASPEQQAPEEAPGEVKEKIRDWKIECKHHAAGARAFFEQGTRIDVLPDKGKTKDTVTVHWRDDYRGSMPPSLALTTAGRPPAEAKQSGQGGGYTAYRGEVEYLGPLGNILFPLPSFWRALNEKTTYTFGAGPRAISVDVYNPRQFKLEVKFPALQSLKAGYKYEAASRVIEGSTPGGLSMTKKKTVTRTSKIEEEGWRPSKLKVDSRTTTHTTTTTGGVTTPGTKPESETKTKLADAIALSRDGGALKLDVAKLVGSILEFIKDGLDLVKTVKKYAPKVGWYIDLDIQVMQGGLAAEWYWKEWQDERVFRYVDARASLEIFSITFEIGVGVDAFSFKLQIFGQISGAFAVELSVNRYKPEGAPGFGLEGKGSIVGAIGARAEAGYVFKFEAKAETALELDLTLGVNQPDRSTIINLDGGVVWTGITCTATGSIGRWGISGTKKWKGTPVGKSDRMHFEWPSPKEYKPPFMSRDAIKAVLVKVLSDGWDVRVFTPSGQTFTPDRKWTLDEMAGALADRIERDQAFHRTPEMVDALGNAIRQDLDALGERWGRDWIEEDRFKAYINGAVDGRSLQKHLKDGASPLRALTG